MPISGVSNVPSPDQLVRVRGRSFVVADIERSALDVDATVVYLDLLEDQTRSFLDKAVDDYRWLLRDARDLRIEGPWLEQLRGALSRVEAQLERSGSATVSR